MLTDKPLNLNQAERISRKFIVEFRFHLDVALLRTGIAVVPVAGQHMQAGIQTLRLAETVFQARQVQLPFHGMVQEVHHFDVHFSGLGITYRADRQTLAYPLTAFVHRKRAFDILCLLYTSDAADD